MKKRVRPEKESGPDQSAHTVQPQDATRHDSTAPASRSRRVFLARVTAASVAAGTLGVPRFLKTRGAQAQTSGGTVCPAPTNCAPGCEVGPQSGTPRADTSQKARDDAAQDERNMVIPQHLCNGDEARYADQNYFASYTKALKKTDNIFGEVDPTAYCSLLQALKSGNPADFLCIILGCDSTITTDSAARFEAANALCMPPGIQRPLVDPQSGLAFDLEGIDSHQAVVAPDEDEPLLSPPNAFPKAPRFDSLEIAGEMNELYWMALTRDVNFTDYDSNSLTQAAAAELTSYGDEFEGPKENGVVTTHSLFRGLTFRDSTSDVICDLVGPYLSQFLNRPIPFGAQMVDPRITTVKPGFDYMTNPSDWLTIQKGCTPSQADQLDGLRYIRNGRDMSRYVQICVSYQAYFNAMLILLAPKCQGGLEAPFDPNNPYSPSQPGSRTQTGFGTFGGPHIATLVGEVATRALKAVWYQKWFVHRRLRPEEYGGRVNFRRNGPPPPHLYPIQDKLLNSQAVQKVTSKYGYSFLPQAFPEGSPIHPSYGAGHGTIAGACVTILKAFFDETFVIPNPIIPSADGLSTVPYTGSDAAQLTVGCELNKLAGNIQVGGRSFAGVHYRSDYTESLKLGEEIAIQLLEDTGYTYNENFAGFHLTKFDGTPVIVGKKKTP